MRYSESSEHKSSGRDEAYLREGYLKEASLRRAYSMLRKYSFFGAVSAGVDEDQWVLINQLLDQGHSEDKIAKSTGLNVSVIALIQNPRRCIEIHSGDPEALRRCIEELDHAAESEA